MESIDIIELEDKNLPGKGRLGGKHNMHVDYCYSVTEHKRYVFKLSYLLIPHNRHHVVVFGVVDGDCVQEPIKNWSSSLLAISD